MKGYIDLFALPLPKKKLARYRKISTAMGKIMLSHGATEYREFRGDDLKPQKSMGPGFLSAVKVKPGEVLVSAVIGYPSKSVRERAKRMMMKDPRTKKVFAMMDPSDIDMRRVLVGGFATFVNPNE
jgi:uncharacterized protein YbaA (DUF1428 family)